MSLEPRSVFVEPNGDRVYLAMDDSPKPGIVPPTFIGAMQGSRRTGKWDLIYLALKTNPLLAITATLRGGVWTFGKWFRLPLSPCNTVDYSQQVLEMSAVKSGNSLDAEYYRLGDAADAFTRLYVFLGVQNSKPRKSLEISFNNSDAPASCGGADAQSIELSSLIASLGTQSA